jgi:hypothetical protein
VDRSSKDRSKRLTRLFLAAAVLVAAVSFTWSELSNDPDCSQGPCRQDGPLILGTAVGLVLLCVYLLAMGALAVQEHRQRGDRPEHER